MNSARRTVNVDPYLVNAVIPPVVYVGVESVSLRLHGAFTAIPAREEHLAIELVSASGETVPTQPPVYLDRREAMALVHDLVRRLTHV